MSEANLLTGLIALLSALACAAALYPPLEHVLNLGLAALAGLAVVVLALALLRRELRIRRRLAAIQPDPTPARAELEVRR
jgi:peptidoglycan/LPS O-acetylase OafA/YrhL